ncbi:MAG: pyridoxal-phosphate dependent enzyme [Ferruginibacter sp.]
MLPFIPDHIVIQQLRHPLLEQKNIKLSIARLDLIHPIVSGNKIFKLRYFLEAALKNKQAIITFGGAFSNHLAATAFACAELGISCTGIVRGEKPAVLSHTLLQCLEYGMTLEFVTRQEYSLISKEENYNTTNNLMFIPEGGFSPVGAKGAADILLLLLDGKPTHICTAVGTTTTLSGLLSHKSVIEFVAIPVLKNMHDVKTRLEKLVPGFDSNTLTIWNDYHFGGYAKFSPELIRYMNDFYALHTIPLDFVYTGKMMFGVWDNIEKNYFIEGDHILCLHTGGLQGNQSLKEGVLVF